MYKELKRYIMDAYEIDKILNDYLKLRKMKQKDLASELHVEIATINRWCKGKSLPDSNTFLNIAHILDIKLDEIVRPRPAYHREQKMIKLLEGFSEDDKNRIMVIMNNIAKINK